MQRGIKFTWCRDHSSGGREGGRRDERGGGERKEEKKKKGRTIATQRGLKGMEERNEMRYAKRDERKGRRCVERMEEKEGY